eukprot:6201156-Pleurochrysis_carterae.AAC.3
MTATGRHRASRRARHASRRPWRVRALHRPRTARGRRARRCDESRSRARACAEPRRPPTSGTGAHLRAAAARGSRPGRDESIWAPSWPCPCDLHSTRPAQHSGTKPSVDRGANAAAHACSHRGLLGERGGTWARWISAPQQEPPNSLNGQRPSCACEREASPLHPPRIRICGGYLCLGPTRCTPTGCAHRRVRFKRFDPLRRTSSRTTRTRIARTPRPTRMSCEVLVTAHTRPARRQQR